MTPLIDLNFKLDGRFKKQLRGTFGQYEFDVGVLKDSPYRSAKPADQGLTKLAGGPVRRKGKQSGISVSEVGRRIREEHGVQYLTKPFENKKNADILRFSKEFFKLCLGTGQKRQVENYLQAVIRNPITRKDYGPNTSLTAKIKGFNRFLIDTGQFFRSITAATRVKRVQK